MPEKSNRILGLDFTERFSYDEQDRLVGALSDTNSSKMPVRQFYETFSMNPEEARIVKRIGEVDKDKNPFEWLFMIGSLPIRATKSIDGFLDYEIPQEALDITQERIQGFQRKLLDKYAHLYNNPEIPNSVKRLARKVRNELYDFGVFISSFGATEVVRESEEDAYRRVLTEHYQNNRRRIQENIPQFAEVMLATFFKFENDSDTMRKVDKRPLKISGFDLSKYLSPINYNYKKELNF